MDKLTSPRKEKKAPYVPNREIIRLFSTRTEDRGREALVLENEECLYNTKMSHGREGDFFTPKNPELIENFQSTHEYIKKMYEHSKSKHCKTWKPTHIKLHVKCVPAQQRTTYFQMAVTHFILSKLQKKGMYWKEQEQTF